MGHAGQPPIFALALFSVSLEGRTAGQWSSPGFESCPCCLAVPWPWRGLEPVSEFAVAAQQSVSMKTHTVSSWSATLSAKRVSQTQLVLNQDTGDRVRSRAGGGLWLQYSYSRLCRLAQSCSAPAGQHPTPLTPKASEFFLGCLQLVAMAAQWMKTTESGPSKWCVTWGVHAGSVLKQGS